MIASAQLAAARAQLADCRLCPRDCRVDRNTSAGGAFCRLGAEAWVYKELLTLGEEPLVSPSWLLDLGGCSWRCLFCSEWRHVVEPRAAPAVLLSPAWFVPRLQRRRQQGARSLTWAGGEPVVSLPAVLAAMAEVPREDWLPVVWKSNGLLAESALALLDGWVAVFNIDAKFGPGGCARRLAGASLSPWPQLARLAEMARPPAGWPPLIVRHLVMPGHVDCCTRPVLAELAQVRPGAALNLMTGYLPAGPAADGVATVAELGRLPTRCELDAALDAARALPLEVWLDGRPLGGRGLAPHQR
jgi:putative pyruvate formate lyase activating enzyme